MSKFVNYKKRGVTLPLGCKDLIDVLEPHCRRKAQSIISAMEPSTVTRDQSGTVKLSEIKQYVQMTFESRFESFVLILSLPDERLTLNFAKMQGEPMLVWTIVEEDAQQARLIREFFIQHSLELPRDDWTPVQFLPGAPVKFIYRISPLPPDAAATSRLAAGLFAYVCSLSADELLTFHCYETTKTAQPAG